VPLMREAEYIRKLIIIGILIQKIKYTLENLNTEVKNLEGDIRKDNQLELFKE